MAARTRPKNDAPEPEADPKPVTAKVTGPRRIVLDTLARHGGVIEDPDGQATVRLFDAMGRDDITIKALQNSLGKMQDRGLVVRDVRGKRTYSIGLPTHLRTDASTDGETDRIDGDGSTTRRDGARRGRVDGVSGNGASSNGHDGTRRHLDDGIDYAELATALLNRVAEVLAAGDPAEMSVILERLGEQTATTQTQARKLLEMAEDLAATRAERDQLRTRALQLEDNVKAILNGRAADNTRALKALERFISKPPSRR